MTRADTRAVDPVWTQASPVEFVVEGKPEPKGSARAFMKPGMRFPIVTSTNPKVAGWEKTIRTVAKLYLGGRVFVGPVVVVMAFHLQRPLALKGRSVCHQTRPDIDKLVRSVLDGLMGAAYEDDGQVVGIDAKKWYADPGCSPSVLIRIETAPGQAIQPQMI